MADSKLTGAHIDLSTPPQAPRRLVKSWLRDVERVDPYAWITDPEEPETAAYLAAERSYYDARVVCLRTPTRVLGDEMVARVPESEPSAHWEAGGFGYRWLAPAGADHQALVRWTLDDPSTTVQTLLDLQVIDDVAGTGYCDAGVTLVSPDGRWLAWSVDLTGDEVYELRFRDLSSGTDVMDVVSRTYYGGAWSADSTAFLYTVHDAAYRPYQVWRHVLGTDSASDDLVVQEDDERYEVQVDGSRSGSWVILTMAARGTSEEWLIPTADLTAPPRLVRPREPEIEYTLEHAPGHGPGGTDGFLVVSNLTDPEFTLFWAPVQDPGSWVPVAAPVVNGATRLYQVDAFVGGYVRSERAEGASRLTIVTPDDAPYVVANEVAGGLVRVGRNDDYAAAAVTVAFESFIEASVYLDVELTSGVRSLRHRIQTLSADPSSYVSKRHLAPAPDGTLVPVITVSHVDTALDGTAPCLLYGYGAYEVNCDPDFGLDWPRTLPSLLDRGVVFAVGQPRGGGEMGRQWWLDGHLGAKPNTLDDQAAVADFLAAGLIDGKRIVSRGLSAGGLLQGALYSRRPERWAGVLAEVPFVDVITTMLDPSLPLTVTEWDEWGDPREPAAYAVMSSYAPIENRPPVPSRPPLLVTGAVHDPRVLVREPAKWVASLRADDPVAGAGTDPTSPVSQGTVIFRCETGAGAHAGPPGRYGQLRYEAEVLAWCCAAMGVPIVAAGVSD
jgi:oligopeptidase B